jgi:acetyl esterase/lipase
MTAKRIGIVLAVLLVIGAAVYAAFALSPWPTVLVIRYAFDKDSAARNRALERHVPPAIVTLPDQRYGEASRALLDVAFPADTGAGRKTFPTIVWIHGGAFVAGSKSDVAPYLKILAARGYTTVGVGYTIAPEAQYPTPVRQANEALRFLLGKAEAYRIDTSRMIIAGDSAGAQIAAQLAAIISDKAYADAVGIAPAAARSQIRGVVLFCGVYDALRINLEGAFGGFLRTALWSYFGVKDPAGDPRMVQFSVNRHVGPQFPPAFISAGNADPLGPQSVQMADALRAQNVAVKTLFFPADYSPPLPHEYQFNLDGEAGRQAFDQLTAFLSERTN